MIITIGLLVVGVFSGFLVFYNHLTPEANNIGSQPTRIIVNGTMISKEHAILAAIKEGNWTASSLVDKMVDATLLLPKISNHVAFVVDDTTMYLPQFPTPEPLKSLLVKEDQLFWEVTIRKQLVGNAFKEWVYDIDAKSGKLIEKFEE